MGVVAAAAAAGGELVCMDHQTEGQSMLLLLPLQQQPQLLPWLPLSAALLRSSPPPCLWTVPLLGPPRLARRCRSITALC